MAIEQNSRKIESLVNQLLQAKEEDPCCEASRRADLPTIEALRTEGVFVHECTDLLWAEASDGATFVLVHYKRQEAQAVLFRLDRRELVRLAESVVHYLGDPVQRRILWEVQQIRSSLGESS